MARERWASTRAAFDFGYGDVNAVEPLADLCTFEVDSENGVATTGEDDYCCACWVRLRLIDGESGNGDVTQADDGTPRNVSAGRGRGVGLGSGRC